MSSRAVPVTRAPSLRLLDRHRPVKGVKLHHCMYRLSVKCAFSDDAGPSRALRTVIGPCFCHSAHDLDAIGPKGSQSPVRACHLSSAPSGGGAS